jgi:hypothetical protein
MSALGKKSQAISPFFFFLLASRRQSIIRIKFCDILTLNLWKDPLPCPAALNPVPVSICLEKSSMLFLSASLLQAAHVNLQTQQVSNTHHM